jgi:anti-sigma B factor antagonist
MVQPRLRNFPIGYPRSVPSGTQPTSPGAPPPLPDEEVAFPLVSHRNNADLPVLEVSGELDLAVAPWLREQLDALFVGGASSLILDLSAATFLDSTALGVLVGALNRCHDLGGSIHLVVSDPQILRVLTITGLSQSFSLHRDRAELLAPGAQEAQE